jgi:hypothetical protein
MRRFPSIGGYLLVMWVAFTGLAHAGGVEAGRRPYCASAGEAPSAEDVADARHLQRTIEANPLFLQPAAASVVRGCTVNFESNGRFVLEYRFRGKQSLRVERDSAIEYISIKSTFELPAGNRAEAILSQAERSSYGANGCGLDMQKPETRPVKYERGLTETVYEGNVCNCRGTIRRDAKNKVIGFILTSAC